MSDAVDQNQTVTGQSPFRGIEPFRLVDQQYYCGREELIGDLVNNVLLYRLIVLFGDSGAGKSSLLNAGLVPELQKRGFQPERLRVRPFSDQPLLIERIECAAEPVQFLPSVFASSTSEPNPPPTFTLSLDDFTKLIESVARLSTENDYPNLALKPSPVLIFDQFEELFTLFAQGKENSAISSEQSLQGQLLNKIASMAGDPMLRVKIILTIREDFLGKLQVFAKQYPRILDHRIRMGMLSKDEAEASILHPFDEPNPFPARFTEALADEIVSQLASTQANLTVPPTQLQIVCKQLWDSFSSKTPRIDVREFKELDEVKGILEGFLTSQLAELKEPLREPAVEILGNLVTDSNTRDVVSQEKIRDILQQSNIPHESFATVVKSLEQRRLINQVAQRGTYYFELSSEFLIEPVQKRWSQVETQRQLANARHEQERKKRKALRIFAGILLLVIAASLLGFYVWNQSQESKRRERQLRYVRDVANMSLAYQDLNSGNFAHVTDLLKSGLPERGQASSDDYRSFLWYYLWRRSHTEFATIKGHDGDVNSVAFSPDSKTLASAGNDKIVILTDVTNERELARLTGHSAAVRSVAFSPDGKLLASASDDETVRLWDAGSYQLVGELKAVKAGPGLSAAVNAVAFSPDGKLIAAGCDDKVVRVWDVASRSAVAKLEEADVVRVVGFSGDGRMLASGGSDKSVKLWDIATKKLVETLPPQTGGILAIAFSPDSQTLAWSMNDKSTKLWDLASHKELAAISEHSDVFSVGFSPDGKILAATGADGAVRLRAVDKLKEMTSDKAPNVADAEIAVLAGHSRRVLTMAFSPDGKMVATGSSDGTVKLNNSSAWQQPAPLIQDEKVFSIAFSPDGRTLAAANDKQTIKLWDMATQRQVASPLIVGNENSFARAVAFSRDGKILAAAVSDGTVKLWQPGGWQSIGSLAGHARAANAVAFSPDGTKLASGSDDFKVKLWDVASRKEIASLSGDAGVLAVTFSPDGQTLASAGYDKKVRLWDSGSGQAIESLPERKSAVLCLAFSPDGRILASGDFDGNVRLWDMERKRELGVLTANLGGVLSIAFSPDGKTLTCTGYDNTIRVWDVSSWQELATLTRVAHSLYSVAFSPDGRTLAAGGFDRTIRFWIAASDDEVARSIR